VQHDGRSGKNAHKRLSVVWVASSGLALFIEETAKFDGELEKFARKS